VEWNKETEESKKQTNKEVDPVKEKGYFKGVLGTGSTEWGLTSENTVPRPEKRCEEELDREIDLEEIHSYLKKAKNGKAVGVDGYPMELWKELGKKENTSRILVIIMNKIFETGEVPRGWKASMIHMIYKGKGNEENPANYRGISLLSTKRKGTVSEFQMGFRKGRRTTDNIFILRTILDKYCNEFGGSISRWNFIALRVQYTSVNYSQQLF
jgi:hypothetical protein